MGVGPPRGVGQEKPLQHIRHGLVPGLRGLRLATQEMDDGRSLKTRANSKRPSVLRGPGLPLHGNLGFHGSDGGWLIDPRVAKGREIHGAGPPGHDILTLEITRGRERPR
jgi:hypothetical protein